MPSLLYPLLESLVEDLWIRVDREQLTPWSFFTAGPPFEVTDFYGKPISYHGIEFEDSPREFYWGRYIEPFLENAVEKVVNETLRLANEKGQDARVALPEAGGLLKTLTRRTFRRMADIDRRLRGKGNPDSVPIRNTESEISNMESFIDRRIEAEIAMLRRRFSINRFYKDHPFLFWFIALVSGAIIKFLLG